MLLAGESNLYYKRGNDIPTKLINRSINSWGAILAILSRWCSDDCSEMSSGRRATRPVRQLSLQQPAPRRQHIRRQKSAEDDCSKSLQIYANPIARDRLATNAADKPKVRLLRNSLTCLILECYHFAIWKIIMFCILSLYIQYFITLLLIILYYYYTGCFGYRVTDENYK